MDLYSQQIALERQMHGAGILRFEKANERHISTGHASEADWFKRLTREFVKPMSQAIDAYLDYYSNRRGKPSASLTYLRCLPSTNSAYIVIRTLFDGLTNSDLTALSLANNIGRRIEDEVRFTKLDEVAPKYVTAIKDGLRKRNSINYKFQHDTLVNSERSLMLLFKFQEMRTAGASKLDIMLTIGLRDDQYETYLTKEQYAVDVDQWLPWIDSDMIQLGSLLIDIFANNMTLNDEALVTKELRNTGKGANKQTAAFIVPTKALEDWVAEYRDVMASMSPSFEPCIIPPRDWTSPFNGGYHTREVSCRLNIAKLRDKKTLRKLSKKQMPKVYQSVNKLQSVPWEVNQRVLDVLNAAVQNNVEVGLPSLQPSIFPMNPVPAGYEELRGQELLEVLDNNEKDAFLSWKREMRATHIKEINRKADVRTLSATIAQANKFSTFEEIYFVYTLDFRSRLYCMSSYISPQGDDLQKSLVRFHNPKKLGENGYFWFCVHGANLWGWDKEEMNERVSRVRLLDFQEKCRDIAADPLTFREWTQADEPWQFLSWCFEYSDLLDWEEEGNDISQFNSRVAVAMDGSCSGIQHYSAILRDSIGGKFVNLLPSTKPEDIYRAVSDVVSDWVTSILDGKELDCPIYGKIEESVTKSLDSSDSVWATIYAVCEEWDRLGISRSLTKKSVMTLPYGSSRLTCRDSVVEYLKDLQATADRQNLSMGMKTEPVYNFSLNGRPIDMKIALSITVALIWEAIGEVVVAARTGMKFITQVANEVAKRQSCLEWTTPTGFIVSFTHFVKDESKRVKTQLMGQTWFRVYEDTKVVDAARMRSSSAPNVIHSMDASHLHLVNCELDEVGVDAIAEIHDSFATYAADTDKLNAVLRSTFVSMYEDNEVLKDLLEENESRLGDHFELELPSKGDLDLSLVKESTYCFS